MGTIIIFYAPWCPHCQAYKPTFIKIAKDITNRLISKKDIKFLALSCVANYDICTTYNIKDYPTILGFYSNKKDPTLYKIMDDEHHPIPFSYSITKLLGVKLLPKTEESEDSDDDEDTEENIEKAYIASNKQIKNHEYPRYNIIFKKKRYIFILLIILLLYI